MPEENEGVAKRVFSTDRKRVRLVVGSYLILEKNGDDNWPHMEDMAYNINRALAPLVAKAEAADEMARILRDRLSWLCPTNVPCGYAACNAKEVHEIKKALASYAAIGDGKGA